MFYGQINNDIKLEESKNGIDYKLEDGHSIILEEDEENEIRNLINLTDNSGRDVQLDTKNNVMHELNFMISGLSDSTSNSTNTNSSPSPAKLERDKTISGISTPISEPELRNKNQIEKLEKEIDKILEDENDNDDNDYNNNNINIELKDILNKYKADLDKICDNYYFRVCTIL